MSELKTETQMPAEGDWKRMIDSIPVKNEAADVIEASGGRVQLCVHNQRPVWHRGPLALLIPMRESRSIELDELGSRLWRACDGKNRVGDLIDQFALRERLEWHEARLLVTGALRSLIEKGILAVAMP